MPEIPPFKGTFTKEQHLALLNPINPRRVFTTQGQSYVPYFEVTAHLIRILGYGNFATEVLDTTLIFESPRVGANEAPIPGKWDACYRATVRLTIFDSNHNVVTTYENVSCGDAQNQARHDAHDLALKSAVSTATKRCAINLGDGFGLSLYRKGSMDAIVMGTLVEPAGVRTEDAPPARDPSEGVAQVENDGIDEIERVDAEPVVTDPEAEARLASSLGAKPIEQNGEQA